MPTNTLLRVTLPSGNPSVFDVQPQHLNEQPGTTLRERVMWYGNQIAVRIDHNWYRRGALDLITDPRTVSLLESCPSADDEPRPKTKASRAAFEALFGKVEG